MGQPEGDVRHWQRHGSLRHVRPAPAECSTHPTLTTTNLNLKMASEFPDYYALLGLQSSASQDEVRQAYKRESLRSHPDRIANASPEEKRRATEKFQVCIVNQLAILARCCHSHAKANHPCSQSSSGSSRRVLHPIRPDAKAGIRRAAFGAFGTYH